jgi:hypothetical protein
MSLRLGKSDFFTNSLGASSQVQLLFHNHSTIVSPRKMADMDLHAIDSMVLQILLAAIYKCYGLS